MGCGTEAGIEEAGIMKRIGIIELEGMEFHAAHGCFEQEKRDGNTFIVDFRGEVDMSAAAMSDDLGDTADYGMVYDIVKREMAIRSDLLEHVTGRIVRALEDKMPQFRSFSVRVSKMNPPVNGKCPWSRVTMAGGSGTGEDA